MSYRDLAFLNSFAPPHALDPYLQSTISKLNEIAPGIWDHLERIEDLPTEAARGVLSMFLEQACLCQNDGNIRIGRYGIGALPQAWLLTNIEVAAESILSAGDPWVFRRLLEIYRYIDDGLMRKLAIRAVDDQDTEIQRCGREFLNLKR